MKRALILYYSFEGSTRMVSRFISANLDIRIEEIKPVKELKSKGFSKYIWGGSQVLMKSTPEIEELGINFDDYDTIFIATPVWAGTYAPPINTLLQSSVIKNKNIALIYTNDGGAGKIESKFENAINLNNKYISAFNCTSVSKNFEGYKTELLYWASKIAN